MGGKTEKLKVNQYDKDGKYIATFDSLNEGLLTATGSLYFMIDFKKKPVSFANGFYWKIDDGDHSDIVPPKRTREDVKGKSLQVNKYDLDGKYIDTFLSLKEAAKSINWKSLNVSVADGSVCYAGGFYWKKEDGDHSDIVPPEKRIRTSKDFEKTENEKKVKKVNQYDKNGKYLKTFNSVQEASELVPGCKSLSLYLKGKYKNDLCGGFQWRYDDGNHCNIESVAQRLLERGRKLLEEQNDK